MTELDPTAPPSASAGGQRSYSLTLARLAARAERQIAATLADSDLRVEHWRILDHLAGRGRSTMSALAEGVLLTGPTLTRTVDKLVSRGLVHRRPGDDDRRQVVVDLTRRGSDIHATLRPSVQAAELAALRADAAEPELRLLAGFLLSS